MQQVHKDSNLLIKQRERITDALRIPQQAWDLKIRQFRDNKDFLVDQPHTPVELIEQVNWKVAESLAKSGAVLSNDAAIGVVYTVEWAVELVYLGCSNVTILTEEFDPAVYKCAQLLRVKYLTLTEALNNKMKFDVIVGNPPFSAGQGNKLLYPYFFRKSLAMSELVAMIMPINLDTNQTKLKTHNHLVKAHSSFISDDVSDHFSGVSVGKMSYIIASAGIKNTVVKENTDKLAVVPVIYPSRKRIHSIKATGNPVVAATLNPGNVTIINKVLKNDSIETETVPSSKLANKKAKSTAPYLCLLNHTPSRGKFNVHIVKNDGSVVPGTWVFAVEVNSLQEAKLLKAHIQSDIIIQHVRELMTALGSHTANKQIISRLPWYE